ncbi:Cell death-inducing p53-target protein 1-like protein [Phlyctema vagabunda]|uniref:Cell death-inducing p53-target protein 1-like protein n=1 Tax=Phlyctema vagabunda TaxID=108571 RepID=A0ABR4PFG3_9HELO
MSNQLPQDQHIHPAPPPEFHQDPSLNTQAHQHNEKVEPPAYPADAHYPDQQQQQQQQPQYVHEHEAQSQSQKQQALPNNSNGTATQFQTASPLHALQKAPSPVDCPVCGTRNMTRTEYASGGTTHLSAFLCCICICLGCIPYLVSGLKDVEHRCGNPACGALLAIWHRSGHTAVQQGGVA